MNHLPKPPTILLTVRDPGAAGHFLQIAGHLRSSGRFRVEIAADEPALSSMRDAGFSPIPFRESCPLDQLFNQLSVRRDLLLRSAKTLLATVKPDILLTGLSSPGTVGVDEAVLKCRGWLPALTYQDFWGEANVGLDALPDRFLVLDTFAKSRTESIHRRPSTIVGSPKHFAYANLHPCDRRRRARELLGLVSDEPLIGWFGQALMDYPDYRETLRAFSREFASQRPRPKLMYRPHPRETPTMREQTLGVFHEHRLNVLCSESIAYEDQLCACDVVASAFSTCGLDLAYLQRCSPEPLGVPLFLRHAFKTREFSQTLNHFDRLPLTSLGCSLETSEAEDLGPAFAAALTDAARIETWTAARRLESPREALNKVDEVLSRTLAAKSSVRRVSA